MSKKKKLIESALKNGYSKISISLNPQIEVKSNDVMDDVQSLFNAIEGNNEFTEIYSTKNKK